MSLKRIAIALASLVVAHAQTGVPASHPAFDVASIKPNNSGRPGIGPIGPIMGGRFNASNIPVNHLIKLAYSVHDFQMSGAPSWTNSDRFDIAAKAEGMDSAPFVEMRPLLQSLLTDRFKLVLHRETKDLPIYELVAAKGGPKLVATKEGDCTVFDPKNPPPTTAGRCSASRVWRL